MASEMGAEGQEAADMLENATPLTTRVETVVLGHMDFTSVLIRLIGMELYKMRRRLMAKVLIIQALLLALLVPMTVGIELAINGTMSAKSFVSTCQTQTHAGSNCTPVSASAQEAIRRGVETILSQPLRLPFSLEMAATQGELNPVIILMIILLGSSAGGELSIGTVRLLFARGPWRGQFLLAKYGAALVCTVLGVLFMALVGVVAGQLFNFLSLVPQGFAFLDAAWLSHALLYLLATMLNWFMYAVVAVFFGILGRSTVAGIAGALTWFFAEPILSNILTFAGNMLSAGKGSQSVGFPGALLRTLPNYFMGNNARALQLNQAQYVFGGTAASQSNLQALITLAIYLVVLIGLTWWLNESRDVTS